MSDLPEGGSIERPTADQQRIWNLVRWIARIWGLAIVFLMVFHSVTDGDSDGSPEPAGKVAFQVAAGILMLGGMLTGWKWELVGGIVSLVGFAGVCSITPHILTQPSFLVFAVPGVLFVLWHWLGRVPNRQT